MLSSSSSTTTNANDDESTNTPQKRAQRVIYERREGIHDPKKQQRAIISARSSISTRFPESLYQKRDSKTTGEVFRLIQCWCPSVFEDVTERERVSWEHALLSNQKRLSGYTSWAYVRERER